MRRFLPAGRSSRRLRRVETSVRELWRRQPWVEWKRHRSSDPDAAEVGVSGVHNVVELARDDDARDP